MKIFISTVCFICFSRLLCAQDAYDTTLDIANMESGRYKTIQAKNTDSYNGVNYDWGYAECYWEIDPGVRYITGRIVHYLEVFEPVDTLYFDFSELLQINAVRTNSEDSDSFFSDAYSLGIISPQTLQAGVHQVEIEYEGVPVNNGTLSFAQSFHGMTPEIYTLSEPYGARDWWPCKHTLTDKLDSIFIEITVPDGNKAGSNGKLIYTNNAVEDFTSYGWKHAYPIPAYLVSLAITNYAEFSQFAGLSNGSEVEILNYVYPERLEALKVQAQEIPLMITLFSDLFGNYPYASEKYGHAMTSIPGGMEHTTMSTMANLGFNLSAHELAHQWFGNKLTCGSWEDIWLNEGFATYLNGLAIERLKTHSDWMAFLSAMHDVVMTQPGGSVFVTDTLSRSRIFDGRLSYYKGASLLHMLRFIMGDDSFFEGCKAYLSDPNLSFSYVHTPDLIAHLENASNIDLSEFFRDWYYGEGFPSYAMEWSKTDEGVGIKLSQISSHSSVDFFDMPVSIRFNGQNDSISYRFDHIRNDQKFFAPTEFDVVSVDFDPEHWLLAKSTSVYNPHGTSDYYAISISPNPVGINQELQVAIPNPLFHAENLEIIDAQGRVVHLERRPGGYSKNFTVSLSDLKAGYYQLRLGNTITAISSAFIIAEN